MREGRSFEVIVEDERDFARLCAITLGCCVAGNEMRLHEEIGKRAMQWCKGQSGRGQM